MRVEFSALIYILVNKLFQLANDKIEVLYYNDFDKVKQGGCFIMDNRKEQEREELHRTKIGRAHV